MERLTNRGLDDYNEPGCQLCSAYCWEMCKRDGNNVSCEQRLIYNRLAAYEDSGLVPDEIGNNLLHYKGFTARIDFDTADMQLYGKVIGIKDTIIFECTPETVIADFHESVNDYLIVRESVEA